MEMGGDGEAGVTVLGDCGGLGSAQREGIKFPRYLLHTEGVLGPQ